jgi:hypothetical protein
LHINSLVILFSASFKALLHHELVLSNSSHLLANLDILSLFRSLVHVLVFLFKVSISKLIFVISKIVNRLHFLIVMLVSSNSYITHLFVVLLKIIH